MNLPLIPRFVQGTAVFSLPIRALPGAVLYGEYNAIYVDDPDGIRLERIVDCQLVRTAKSWRISVTAADESFSSYLLSDNDEVLVARLP